MPLEVPSEVAETVRQRCRDFLGEPWASAEDNDIKIERLSGCTNLNVSATLTLRVEGATVHHKVMVHLYGSQIFGADCPLKYNGEAAEAVVTEMLSQKRLAPIVLGVFPGGRIEEFIPSRCLKLSDLEDVTLTLELARKLARLHAFDAPICKKADRPEVMLEQVTPRVLPVNFGDAPESDKVYYYNFLNFPLREEITHVSKIMSKIGGKPVFCHGDLNMTNILLRDGATQEGARIVFVDLELSSYFYRGFDFAYYLKFREVFHERVGEQEVDVKILDDVHLERDKALMVEAYLDEWKRLHNGQTCAQDTIEHLTMEIDFALLAVLLNYACLMRLAVITWTDPLRFEDPSKKCEEYFAKKKFLLEKYGDPSVDAVDGRSSSP